MVDSKFIDKNSELGYFRSTIINMAQNLPDSKDAEIICCMANAIGTFMALCEGFYNLSEKSKFVLLQNVEHAFNSTKEYQKDL